MIYTELTKKAMKISFEAHKDQVDKSGIPYVYHPFHVAEQMDDEITTCVALLHDVIEDSNITYVDLIFEGFPREVADAVALLTHDDGEPYMEYIKRIKSNPIAAKVKIADLEHNSDITRLDAVSSAALARVEKYRRALFVLRFPEERPEPMKKIRARHVACCDIDVPYNCRYCTMCGEEIFYAPETEMEVPAEETVCSCEKCSAIMSFADRYCGQCGAKARIWRK